MIQLSRKELWTEFWRDFGSSLLRTPVIAFFAATLTTPFWIPALMYLFLRSFEIAPSGIFAWATVVLSSVGCVWGLYRYFPRQKYFRPIREARRSLLNGDPGAAAMYEAARAAYRGSKPQNMFWGMICLLLLIPSLASLGLWSDIQVPDYRLVHGKLKVFSPQQQLRIAIRSLEDRGIFKPVFHFEE